MAKSKASPKRVYAKTQKLTSDLFKLEAADCKKNIAWQDNAPPHYENITHCHFFYSLTDRGVKQFTSTHSSGHFHEMILVQDATDDSPAVYECSPPLKYVHEKVADGKGGYSFRKKSIPYDTSDKHSHDVSYIDSREFTPRKPNMEAQKLIASEQLKGAPVSGIISQ